MRRSEPDKALRGNALRVQDFFGQEESMGEFEITPSSHSIVGNYPLSR
jgi:hypothetical protein